ncbi:MAG: aldo/keto reductase [Microthrixaceae bacterium]
MRLRLEPGGLSLGCAPMGNLYRKVPDDDVAAVVHTAFERGVNLFDTAPHYGYGLSESRLGAALAGRPRDDYLLATKVGRLLLPVDQVGETDGDIFVGTPPVRSSFDFSADGVRRSLEESLGRLGVDRVDIVHVHDPEDHLEQAITEAYPALLGLRDEGVIDAVGLGTNFAEVAGAVLSRVDLDCILLAGRVTLLDDSGIAVLDRCAERNVSVFAAGVFNSGILADPSDGAHFHYEPASEEVLDRARTLQAVCEAHGTTVAAAALGRPRLHPAVATVVVGAADAAELSADLDLAEAELPEDLWGSLRAAGAAV